MPYTAVLRDEMWAWIEPSAYSEGGHGSIYRLRTGCAWRDLSVEFGPWQTVWNRRARLCKNGTWDSVLIALQTEADAGGEIDWHASVDSTIARVC